MNFNNFSLKTSVNDFEHIDKAQDIDRINKVIEPYGLKVDEVKEGAQIVRYIINLPLDARLQGKIRRASKDIEYTLSSALRTDSFSYIHTEENLVIERQGKFNTVLFGNLYTPQFVSRTSGLALMLGLDLDGKPVYTNLEKAPHILIAGTTGSGKSETLHSIIASLLMSFKFRKDCGLALVIIDMKGSEFNKYKDAYPVTIVRDADKAFETLEVLCRHMDYRYKQFAECNADDIDEYISKGHKMSRMVCVIDELADLMLQNRAVENHIVRLAQKARACGIHLVIGTQSPRADVVTGLIKANMPFKIALNTATALESRIILGENGAEKLFGKGDMLIKKGGNKAIHAQGCYVDDADKIALNNVCCNGNHVNIYPAKETPADDAPFGSDEWRRQFNDDLNKIRQANQKKPGLFQKLKNIWNAPQQTTARDFITVIRR